MRRVVTRRFFAELGEDVPRFFDVLRTQATTLVSEGAARDSLFAVSPRWRMRLWAVLERQRFRVNPDLLPDIAAFLDRALGNEVARQAFGAAYSQRRSVREDSVVQRAADILRRARTPRDVFGE